MEHPGFTREGEDVPLTCLWGQNTDDKTVSWYKQNGNNRTLLWLFRWEQNSVLQNHVERPFDDKLRHDVQESYQFMHTITLVKPTESESGIYTCVITIENVDFVPPATDTLIVSGMTLFVKSTIVFGFKVSRF